MVRFDSLLEKRKPTRLAWVGSFYRIALPVCIPQEENVIEASPPTHEAIMLQGMQQRRQALVGQSFMTDANVNGMESYVKQRWHKTADAIDKTTALVHAYEYVLALHLRLSDATQRLLLCGLLSWVPGMSSRSIGTLTAQRTSTHSPTGAVGFLFSPPGIS
jgi:hypothetical protein